MKRSPAERAVYQTWTNMRYRCTKPNATGFRFYGGRGVRVEFSSFEEFFAEIGPKPSPHTASIE